MKKRSSRLSLGIVVVFMFVLGTALISAAQMGDDKAAGSQTVTGCLQKGTEPVGFFIIGENDKHWELYANSDVALADHVGHTVTVTGTVAHRSKEQEAKSQPHEKKETGERQHADLQVSSMKMVSTSCNK